MKGLITIDKTAVGTDSFLGEFGMNLSKAGPVGRDPEPRDRPARLPPGRRTQSSVGPIDETQLFYLESRGIPPDEARKFIVLGFLEPVVARVPLAAAQDRLRELLEEKWAAGVDGGRRRGRCLMPPTTSAPDGRRVRRIDLLAVDEVPDGTMKMAWVDGTDQVLVVNADGESARLPGHLHATSTSSSTRAS